MSVYFVEDGHPTKDAEKQIGLLQNFPYIFSVTFSTDS